MVTKKRIEWVDLARALAILLVVLCHSLERAYPYNVSRMTQLPQKAQIAAFFGLAVGRLSTPFFMMLSGYLLLDRKYDTEGCIRFWKKNWLHLFLCTEIWFVIYDLFLYFYKGQSLKTIIYNLLFIKAVDMSHVWYLYMLIGMYILIPFVAMGLGSLSPRLLWFPLLFYSLFTFGLQTARVLMNALHIDFALSTQNLAGFSGGVYGLYFLFGYGIKKGGLRRVPGPVLALTMLAALAGGTWEQYFAYSRGVTYNIWPDSIFVLLSSLSAFELLSRIKRVPALRLTKTLARYSFAIYLIHIPVRAVLSPGIAALGLPRPLHLLVIWLLLVVLSLVIAFLISLIPKVGKYILYIK